MNPTTTLWQAVVLNLICVVALPVSVAAYFVCGRGRCA